MEKYSAGVRKNFEELGIGIYELSLLLDKSKYLDDVCAQTANILLQEKFPGVKGFGDTLHVHNTLLYRLRESPPAANIYHCGRQLHFVSAAYLEVDVVLYFDSLKPGSEPKNSVVDQIRASFAFTRKKFKLLSVQCQKQGGVDCLCFCAANLDAVLSGKSASCVRFYKKSVRRQLLRSFENGCLKFKYLKSVKSRGKPTIFNYEV